MPAASRKKIFTPKQLQQPNFALGCLGENHAASYLVERGFLIIVRNFQAPNGQEIDLIALDDQELVFIEVKTRRVSSFGHPSLAVNAAKIEHLTQTATAFLEQFPAYQDFDFRFDVLSLVIDRANQVQDLEHFINITWFADETT